MSVSRVVVAGGGVAGLSTAMHVARAFRSSGRRGEVVVVDPRPPMTATSSVSTECYRGFFLDAALTPFIDRSIDVMEELQRKYGFLMGRRGYAFVCGSADGRAALRRFGEAAAGFGAGEFRQHSGMGNYVESPAEGWDDARLTGFDFVEGDAVRQIFPFLTPEANTLLHCRRAGWVDAYGLGTAFLDDAREEGKARVLLGSVAGFDRSENGDVTAVRVTTAQGEERIDCDAFVNAAGPWAGALSTLIAPHAPLPVQNEIHSKVMFHDVEGVIPQTAPFMIWRDPITMPFGDDWHEAFIDSDDTDQGGHMNSKTWLKRQPGGIHFRPAGNGRVLMLWEHIHRHINISNTPSHPPTELLFHEMYPELCIAGLRSMVPGLEQYQGNVPRDTVTDGGFYTVTPDGRPIIGPYGARNAIVCCGFNGWGIMASAAAGELAAAHALGQELPEYAAELSLRCPAPRAPPPTDLLDESVGGDAAPTDPTAALFAKCRDALHDADAEVKAALKRLPGSPERERLRSAAVALAEARALVHNA